VGIKRHAEERAGGTVFVFAVCIVEPRRLPEIPAKKRD